MNTSQHVLYIGSYASTDQPGIYVCTFDDTTGELGVRGSFAGVTNPSFLVVHPNGRSLYAVSETNQQKDGTPGAVWAFRCIHESWSIEPLNHQLSGGDLPCHLEIDASGRWLLVSNYGSGSVGVLPILADGTLGEMTDLDQHHGNGPHPERQEGPHAHSATFTRISALQSWPIWARMSWGCTRLTQLRVACICIRGPARTLLLVRGTRSSIRVASACTLPMSLTTPWQCMTIMQRRAS
jgi:hypothetical protein